MSKLYIVRHGQASFFSDDYDKLSEMGERQSRVLAEYWIDRGEHFDEVYTGTLQRQQRTAEVVGETFRERGLEWPETHVFPGLDEYPADDVMDVLLPQLCERDERMRVLRDEFEASEGGPARYRSFHRLLEAVMARWIGKDYEPGTLTTWEEFSGGVRGAFQEILEKEGNGRRVAVFSSGGPVGISVQTALGAPEIKAAELNWRVHNCSFTEFTFSGSRLALDSFNAVPHLSDPELLTYR